MRQFLISTAMFFAIYALVAYFHKPPTDPTDLSADTRSGLIYYKDYGTGQEYLSAPFCFCLIKREQP